MFYITDYDRITVVPHRDNIVEVIVDGITYLGKSKEICEIVEREKIVFLEKEGK